MKNITKSILCLILIGWNLQVQAQIDLSKEIKISLTDTPPSAVFALIQQETNIPFTYLKNRINLGRTISFNCPKSRVDSILNQFCRATELDFHIYKGAISIKPSKALMEKYHKGLLNRATIYGYITDEETHETVLGATIYFPSIENGVISNDYGYYSIDLKRGKQKAIIRYIGYKEKVVEFDLKSNQQIDIALKNALEEFKPVIVEGEKNIKDHTNRFHHTMQYIPSPTGQSEPIKSLDNIAGVSSQGDGSVFLHVRGGNKDQNLILLDDAPIYNPAHLFGFFSSFSPDAIKTVRVYKKEIPVELGGRLSSIVDIKTKNGDLKKWRGFISSNPFTSTGSIQGPIIKDKFGVYLSGRRSHFTHGYFNLILSANYPIYFYDLNFKSHCRINANNKIFLSIYDGVDFLSIPDQSNIKAQDLFYDVKNTSYFDNITQKTGIALGWRNRSSSLRWNHIINPKFFSNTTLSYSNYDYRFKLNDSDSLEVVMWKEDIKNYALKQDYSYYPNKNNKIHFGIEMKRHEIDPGNLYGNRTVVIDSFPKLSLKQANHLVAYFSKKMNIDDKYELYAGLRANYWMKVGPTTVYQISPDLSDTSISFINDNFIYYRRFVLEPRFYFKNKINDQNEISFSFDRTAQFMNLLSNSISPFTNLDYWVTSGLNVPVQTAQQINLGYQFITKDKTYLLNLDSYYRILDNQMEFSDHAQLMLNPYVYSEIKTGYGYTYGIEFSAEKLLGKFRGLMTYHYLQSKRVIEGINNNRPYHPFFEKPHDFSLVLDYLVFKKLEVFSNFKISSGFRYTSPTAFYQFNGKQIPVFTEVNNDRLPTFHKLDLGIKYLLNKENSKRFHHYLVISVINVYNRRNIFSINNLNFAIDPDNSNNLVIPTNELIDYNYVNTSNQLYGIIPTLNYSLSIK